MTTHPTVELDAAPSKDTEPPKTRSHRRAWSAAVALLAVSALLLGACYNPSVERYQGRAALNNSRTYRGIPALRLQSAVESKAQAWADRLARENRLYHSTLSDGVRTRWCNLGENVGYGSSIKAVQASFMASSGHRANILNRVWNGMAVGVAHRGTRTFVVQVFIRAC